MTDPRRATRLKSGAALAVLTASFIAAPYHLSFGTAGTGFLGLEPAYALAGDDDRDERRDREREAREERRDREREAREERRDRDREARDDRRDQEREAREDRRDREREAREDRRDRGDDRDDDRNDDRGGRHGGDDDRRGGHSIERALTDGGRVEIENGRYERKDRFGNTIEERPARADDYRLLGVQPPRSSQATAQEPRQRGQETAASAGNTRSGAARRGGGVVAQLEVAGNNIEITYTDGWREEIENGRYELKDNYNRTVIERPATGDDRARLFAAVR